jgi:hypothetical protein
MCDGDGGHFGGCSRASDGVGGRRGGKGGPRGKRLLLRAVGLLPRAESQRPISLTLLARRNIVPLLEVLTETCCSFTHRSRLVRRCRTDKVTNEWHLRLEEAFD